MGGALFELAFVLSRLEPEALGAARLCSSKKAAIINRYGRYF
jgi:hypothetical protein